MIMYSGPSKSSLVRLNIVCIVSWICSMNTHHRSSLFWIGLLFTWEKPISLDCFRREICICKHMTFITVDWDYWFLYEDCGNPLCCKRFWSNSNNHNNNFIDIDDNRIQWNQVSVQLGLEHIRFCTRTHVTWFKCYSVLRAFICIGTIFLLMFLRLAT